MGRLDVGTLPGAGNQYLQLRVHPDLPWTSGDETAVEVIDGYTATVVIGCGDYPGAPTVSPPCVFTLTPGDELVFGITAGAVNGTASLVTEDRANGGGALPPRVIVAGHCPTP